jgi:hypothetical protein
MKVWIVVIAIALGACAKKKEAANKELPPAADQAPANPTSTSPTGSMPGEGAAKGGGDMSGSGSSIGNGSGSAEPRTRMPSDDGGEIAKPMPSDDGGEATKHACTKAADCGDKQDCCNGFCYKQGTAKHAIECKLPSGKL